MIHQQCIKGNVGYDRVSTAEIERNCSLTPLRNLVALRKVSSGLSTFLPQVLQYLERSTVVVVLSLSRSSLVPLSLNWFHTLLFLQIYFTRILESQVIHES